MKRRKFKVGDVIYLKEGQNHHKLARVINIDLLSESMDVEPIDDFLGADGVRLDSYDYFFKDWYYNEELIWVLDTNYVVEKQLREVLNEE